MILNKDEFLDLMDRCYNIAVESAELKEQAKEISKQIPELLKSFAESNEIDKSCIVKNFEYYKKLRDRLIPIDNDQYFTMSAIIEEKFLTK